MCKTNNQITFNDSKRCTHLQHTNMITQTCMSNLITNLHINIPQKICTNTKQILDTQITKNDVTSQAHGFYTKSMKSLKSHSRDSKLIYH